MVFLFGPFQINASKVSIRCVNDKIFFFALGLNSNAVRSFDMLEALSYFSKVSHIVSITAVKPFVSPQALNWGISVEELLREPLLVSINGSLSSLIIKRG